VVGISVAGMVGIIARIVVGIIVGIIVVVGIISVIIVTEVRETWGTNVAW